MLKILLRTALATGLLMGFVGAAAAEGHAAEVILAQGEVAAIGKDGKTRPLAEKSTVLSGETVTTGKAGRARLSLTDGSVLKLNAGTRLQLQSYQFQQGKATGRYVLSEGSLGFVAGKAGGSADHQLQTPMGTIASAAGTFDVQNCLAGCKARGSDRRFPNGIYVRIHAGDAVLSNTAGQLATQPGQIAYIARQSKAPQLVTRFPDADF